MQILVIGGAGYIGHEVRNFIFLSTAAISGEPEYTPIDENPSKRHINEFPLKAGQSQDDARFLKGLL